MPSRTAPAAPAAIPGLFPGPRLSGPWPYDMSVREPPLRMGQHFELLCMVGCAFRVTQSAIQLSQHAVRLGHSGGFAAGLETFLQAGICVQYFT